MVATFGFSRPAGEPVARDGHRVDEGAVRGGDGGGGARVHAETLVRRAVGEGEDQDRLHAEEREALSELQAGGGEKPLRLTEEGMIVFGWRLLAARVGIDHCSGQIAYSWSYELIKNIPGVAGRRPW